MTTFDATLIARELNRGLQDFVLPVEPAWLAEQLTTYVGELHKWNRAYNLTAVRDPEAMLPRHIYDSLTALPFVHGTRIADVGTGAGLPGIPLALCYPDKQFTLIDANGKKTRFIQHAVAHLGLGNVTVEQVRAESLQPAQPFDTVISRAYASLADFIATCGQLLADDGALVAMKGKYPADELAHLPTGWVLHGSQEVHVPGLEGERHILTMVRDGSP